MRRNSINKILILVILIIGVALGAVTFLNMKHKRENDPNRFNVTDKQIVNQDTALTTEVTNDFLKSMNEKQLIHYKIINSIDFFHTVKGEINQFGISFDNEDIKFNIDVKSNMSLIEINSKSKDIKTIFNDGKCRDFDENNKTYRDIQVVSQDEYEGVKKSDLSKLMPNQRYNEGNVILPRNTELLLGVDKSILSEAILGTYMKDYSKWNIEGNEEFLGRKCVKISGLRYGKDERSKAEKYIALIDDETGIVLKYDELDANDKAVNGFSLKEIKFNEAMNKDIFNLDVEGYSKQSFDGK